MWMTPLDMVRSVNQLNIVGETKVIPSSVWKIKSIQESNKISKEVLNNIIEQQYTNFSTNVPSTENFINLELKKSYNDYLIENNQISKKAWNDNDDILKNRKENVLQNGYLEFSNYKRPDKTIQDSQLYLELNRNSKYEITIGMLPASHKIEDNNSEYSNESELKLGDIAFTYIPKNKMIKMEKVTLYSAMALRPVDKILGGISGKFEMGYGKKRTSTFEQIHSYNIGGGLGRTYRLTRDFDVFTLINLGISYRHDLNLQAGPEIGFLVREIYNMKTVASFEKSKIGKYKFSTLNQLKIIQAFNFHDFSFNLKWNYDVKENNNDSSYAIAFKKYF